MCCAPASTGLACGRLPGPVACLGRPGPLALRLCGHGLLHAAWAASCPLGRPVACAWATLVMRHLGHRLPAAGPADGRLGLVRLWVAELAILFNMAEACKSVINRIKIIKL